MQKSKGQVPLDKPLSRSAIICHPTAKTSHMTVT